jgi:ADP-heptose:LPS heptosyltransferase
MNHPEPPRHILVSRTDKIGDLLLSLPVFQTLKDSFPQTKITALVSPYAQEIVRDHPSIDAVELLKPEEGVFDLTRRFRQLNPDVFIALYPRPLIALAAWRAGISMRIGTAFRWYSFSFNSKIKVHRSVCDRHEAEYNLDLVRPLHPDQIAEKIVFPVSKADQDFADDLLKEKGISKRSRFVAVHPGHKGSALNWKSERYAEAIRQLCLRDRLKVVVTAGPDETALIAKINDFLFNLPPEKKPILLIGECTLKQLAAVYRRADCFLSGSTGTMHLAAAVGTPTVALFCPIPATTPVRWGPWGNRAVVILPKNLQCPQCRSGSCRKHDPMDAITLSEVLEAMDRYIGKAR